MENKENVNIIYSSDNNYAQPLGVSIYSLLDNFKSNKYQIVINILDGDISYENKTKLINISTKFKTQINFIQVDKNKFSDFPKIQHLSAAAYYRLSIPEMFPDLKKCIYLDCDTLIIGNLEGLCEEKIDNYILAAVEDNVAEQVLKMDCPFFKYIKKYFNSGVLIMNLEKMRQENFTNVALDFTKTHAKELLYADQDVLNFLSIDKWLVLDNKYNIQVNRSQTKIDPTPVVLHYTTGYKPWYRFYNNYYQKYYKYYMEKWPGYKIKETTPFIAIKQMLKYIPYSVPTARFFKKITNKLTGYSE